MSTTSTFRRSFIRHLAAALVAAACLAVPSVARAEANGVQVLFTQQDTVQAFDFVTGRGFQTGTATGLISGTTSVIFQFTIVGPPGPDLSLPIVFHNQVVITDIDGDQITFDNDGDGHFNAGIPGSTFVGTGGPLRGTYTVTGATGKFSTWKVGSTFTYKAIATNPPNGALGTVYVQVTFRGRDDLK